jgi:hypothetical protein
MLNPTNNTSTMPPTTMNLSSKLDEILNDKRGYPMTKD